MTVRGFYRWMPEGDQSGVGASGAASRPADESPSPTSPATGPGPAGEPELEIEKRWLQLTALDPEAFDRFYDKYHDRIFAFAFWRTGDEDAATDVTAETFLTAWEKRRKFRWQGYTFGAWLFQIARGVISHRHRHEAVRKETEYEPGRHDLVTEDTPDTDLEARTNNMLITACLEGLSENQREVIVLHHFVGLAVRQIAHVTRTPSGTVASHLRRGKTALRRCLEEHGPENGLSEKALRIIRQAAADESGLRVVDDDEERNERGDA